MNLTGIALGCRENPSIWGTARTVKYGLLGGILMTLSPLISDFRAAIIRLLAADKWRLTPVNSSEQKLSPFFQYGPWTSYGSRTIKMKEDVDGYGFQLNFKLSVFDEHTVL